MGCGSQPSRIARATLATPRRALPVSRSLCQSRRHEKRSSTPCGTDPGYQWQSHRDRSQVWPLEKPRSPTPAEIAFIKIKAVSSKSALACDQTLLAEDGQAVAHNAPVTPYFLDEKSRRYLPGWQDVALRILSWSTTRFCRYRRSGFKPRLSGGDISSRFFLHHFVLRRTALLFRDQLRR